MPKYIVRAIDTESRDEFTRILLEFKAEDDKQALEKARRRFGEDPKQVINRSHNWLHKLRPNYLSDSLVLNYRLGSGASVNLILVLEETRKVALEDKFQRVPGFFYEINFTCRELPVLESQREEANVLTSAGTGG